MSALELLKKHSPHEEQTVLEQVPELKRAPPKDPYQGIRCPRCQWRPVAESRWYCGRGECRCVWNTFDTRGRCPACSHQWLDTACLQCHRWSPHEEWYEKPASAE